MIKLSIYSWLEEIYKREFAKKSTYPIESTSCLIMCACWVAQSCPTLCDPKDRSPPGFSVHGILQARILKWVAIPSSRGSSWLRDQTWISYVSCICRRILLPMSPLGSPCLMITNISFLTYKIHQPFNNHTAWLRNFTTGNFLGLYKDVCIRYCLRCDRKTVKKVSKVGIDVITSPSNRQVLYSYETKWLRAPVKVVELSPHLSFLLYGMLLKWQYRNKANFINTSIKRAGDEKCMEKRFPWVFEWE